MTLRVSSEKSNHEQPKVSSGISFRKRRRRFIKDLGGKILWKLEGYIARRSLVGNHRFFASEQFPWASVIEKDWKLIQSELAPILEEKNRLPSFQDISKDQTAITNDDLWKTYFLYGMGYKAEANCSRCPETTRLVEQIPGMTTAFFSILSPHKHIPPHRGVFKGFIRYHLGIRIPEPHTLCRLRIEDEYASWEAGKSLIFDDTFEHEVWNDSEETRVVLFVDVLRPLPFIASSINRFLIGLVKRSAYVQDARKNQDEWEAAFKPSNPRSGRAEIIDKTRSLDMNVRAPSPGSSEPTQIIEKISA